MQVANVGAYVSSPQESCLCCFGLRQGLKLAVYTMGLATLLGIIQTFGMFALYSGGFSDVLSENAAGFAPSLILFVILIFRCVAVFGFAMTVSWTMKDSKTTRDNLVNGLMT